MDMAFPGVNYCSSAIVDTKQQNNRQIFQPLRLLSTAATSPNTMHHSKSIDFPFVPLTGHKLVNDPCIPTSFDIVNDHANFEHFLFDKGSTFTKNTSLKGCNQFPVFSISQLVGGFVGSKSQLRSESRESPQIWDVVFQKLDEFINSRTTERYSQQCYGLQALSKNIFDSLCEESNPALGLGLAASYILADGCQSFRNTKNIVKSSPPTQNCVQSIPTPVNSSASLGSFTPSHSPSSEIVKDSVSQPDAPVTPQNISLPVPLEIIGTGVGGLDHSVPATVAVQTSGVCDNPSETNLNFDQLGETSPLVSTEGKQSYAEVAKMALTISKRSSGRHRPVTDGLMSCSKPYRNVDNHNYSRDCGDPRQRCVDSSNWRSRGTPRGKTGLKRDDNRGPSSANSDVCYWTGEQNLKTAPEKMSQAQRRKSHERLKHFRNFNGGTLKTVPEVAPNTATKQVAHEAKSFVGSACRPAANNAPCQYYNLNKKSCVNWRCRQHIHKSSVKRNFKHVLNDGDIGENLDDQMPAADLPSSPDDESAVKPNTFENYITPTTPHSLPGRDSTCNLRNLKHTKCDTKSGVQSLPNTSANDACTGIPICSKVGPPTDPTRIPGNFCVILSPSESSDGGRGVPRSRSISEESRASSSSTSSVNSCKLASEANPRGRFSSECDSEDSFVIFEGGVDCADYNLDSLSDSSDDGSDFESDDELDSAGPPVSMVICVPLRADDIVALSPKMQEVNAKWERICSSQGKKPSCKKVRFASSPTLAVVHPMVKWEYAYRAARCGPWEEMARDRERFKQRVERSEPMIAPVLEATHRDKVATLLLDAGRHDQSADMKPR